MIKNFNKYDKIIKKASKINEDKKKIDIEIKNLAIKAIKSKKANSIFMVADSFAEDLGPEIIAQMVNAVIEIGDPKFIYQFATIKEAPIDKLAKGLIETNSPMTMKYILEFASKIKDAPINTLTKATIKKGSGNDIYQFALLVPDAPVDKLAFAILDKGDSANIEDFASNIFQMSTSDFYDVYGRPKYQDYYEIED